MSDRIAEEPLRVDLRARWLDHAGGRLDVADEVIARYAEPGRHYHGLEHLLEVLRHIDELSSYAEDPTAVRWAGWFHDAVYDVHRDDNEDMSARFAQSTLVGMGIAGPLIDETIRLVRLTATHAVDAGDSNGAVLCDADLAILASSPARYSRYAHDVRREYEHVDDGRFRAGRLHILTQLLAHPHFFNTESAASRWEARARANVEREMSSLRAEAERDDRWRRRA
jgi:predicted metal-dependent HD superfamily phosphohydrolase